MVAAKMPPMAATSATFHSTSGWATSNSTTNPMTMATTVAAVRASSGWTSWRAASAYEQITRRRP